MATKFDLKSLDIKTAGFWPRQVQMIFYAAVALLVLAVGWFLLLSGKVDQLQQAEKKEAQLRSEYVEAQSKAANLQPLKKQLAQIDGLLQNSLRQLPSKTEMPEILNDISRAALETGINTELFQPQPETLKDFYAERPVQLRMIGGYHQFGQFMTAVSKLSRVIVITPTDASFQPFIPSQRPTSADDTGISNVLQETNPQRVLAFDGLITTYRYLDSDEQAGQDKIRDAEEAAEKKKQAAAAKKKAGKANKADKAEKK